jgi:hypothetical protein
MVAKIMRNAKVFSTSKVTPAVSRLSTATIDETYSEITNRGGVIVKYPKSGSLRSYLHQIEFANSSILVA